MEAEWKVHEASNFDEAQWRGPDVSSSGWEVTPPTSLPQEVVVHSQEVDLLWPGLAAQVDDCCGTLPAFPSNTLEIEVKVEERTSVGDLTEEGSTCRSTII
jgi:hypothetical protein